MTLFLDAIRTLFSNYKEMNFLKWAQEIALLNSKKKHVSYSFFCLSETFSNNRWHLRFSTSYQNYKNCINPISLGSMTKKCKVWEIKPYAVDRDGTVACELVLNYCIKDSLYQDHNILKSHCSLQNRPSTEGIRSIGLDQLPAWSINFSIENPNASTALTTVSRHLMTNLIWAWLKPGNRHFM